MYDLKRLERVDKKDDEDRDDDDAIEEYRKSKEQLQREIERQQLDLQEKMRELEQTDSSLKIKADTNVYRYKKAATVAPAQTPTTKPAVKPTENELFINPMTMPLMRFGS